VITIMGTWCPNCRDETAFLVEYLHKNKNMNLGVIGLAFERSAEAAQKQLPIYKDRMKVPYEIAVAATTTQKDEAAKALPMLNAIIGYPTMIILDKKGNVRKIHTGFDGPATSKYKVFQQEFDDLVKKLNSES
jgi:thiol-disulfide isomerase/thioredoxin